jgi:hypothetical protein
MEPKLASIVNRLVQNLGIQPVVERDALEEAVAAVLAERGLDAAVTSVRWGVLELTCDARTARLLRFDHDTVLAAAKSASSDVNELRVRVR